MKEIRTNSSFWSAIVFLMAFCSLNVQFMIASKMSYVTEEGLFIYPICLGIFLMAMGLGASRVSSKTTYDSKKNLKRLIIVEFIVCALGFLSITTIEYIRSEYYLRIYAIYTGCIFSFLLGYFTGKELPLVINILDSQKQNASNIRMLFFFDYFASLFSSIIFTLLMKPYFGLYKTSIINANLNLIIVFLLVFCSFKNNRKPLPKKLNAIMAALAILISASLTITYSSKLDNYFLEKIVNKRMHDMFNLKLVKRENTFYQEISLFVERNDRKDPTTDYKEILEQPEKYHLFGFLDSGLQFVDPLGVKEDPYHFMLFDPIMQIYKPKKILILGGGDGLPARQTQLYEDIIEDIVMVDLDPEWIEFTRTDELMKYNTQNALNNPKIRFYGSDAFKWIIKTDEKFDAIFVDFPGTNNLASLRIGTVQFMNDLRRILKPEGVIISQDDVPLNKFFMPSIFSTAKAAGFSMLFGERVKSNIINQTVSQFMLFRNDKLKRDYLYKFHNYYKPNKKNKARLKKYGYINYKRDPSEDGEIISFYDPIVLQFSINDITENLTGY